MHRIRDAQTLLLAEQTERKRRKESLERERKAESLESQRREECLERVREHKFATEKKIRLADKANNRISSNECKSMAEAARKSVACPFVVGAEWARPKW